MIRLMLVLRMLVGVGPILTSAFSSCEFEVCGLSNNRN